MSIETTFGMQRVWGDGSYSDPVTMYDTVTGMSFGPTFEDQREADAFQRWFEGQVNSFGYKVELRRMLHWTYDEQKATAEQWRKHLAEHAPGECPFDEPSAGVGFLGDRDATDGSGAYTPRCFCECHEGQAGRKAHRTTKVARAWWDDPSNPRFFGGPDVGFSDEAGEEEVTA